MKKIIKSSVIFLLGALFALPLYTLALSPAIYWYADVEDLYGNDAPWYSEGVIFLSSIGVVQGYEDNTFRPANPVNRAEFATMLTSYHKNRVQKLEQKLDKVVKVLCMDETEVGSERELLMEEICPEPGSLAN